MFLTFTMSAIEIVEINVFQARARVKTHFDIIQLLLEHQNIFITQPAMMMMMVLDQLDRQKSFLYQKAIFLFH